MKKPTKESIKISGYVHDFLNVYAPTHKTGSGHTLRSYEDALVLYMKFLETEKKVCGGDLGGSCFHRRVAGMAPEHTELQPAELQQQAGIDKDVSEIHGEPGCIAACPLP